MTKVPGKFKQLRLGDLQRQILNSIVELNDSTPNQKGYTIKQIIQKLFNYISIPHSSFWIPSVEAQSLLEKGEATKSIELLLKKTYELSERALPQTSNEKHILSHKKAIGVIPIMLEGIKIREMTPEEQSVTRRLVLELASDAIESSPFYRQTNNRAAGYEKEDAERASHEANKRYASVSRAIRVLVQHGLLEKVSWETSRWSDGPLESHSGYALTDLGILRLNE